MRATRYLWLGVGLLALGVAPAPTGAADEKKADKKEGKTYDVPYRLTVPKHILVRAKINGKGPFNFILDTGAPALFFTEKVAEKCGVARDKNGWGTCDKVEIEGGVVMGQLLDRDQEQHLAVGQGQVGERLLEPALELRCRGLLERRRRHLRRGALLGAQELGQRPAPVAGVQVARDREQPRAQAGVVAQPVGVAGQPQPGLLQEVLGQVAAPGQAQQEPVNARAPGHGSLFRSPTRTIPRSS